MGKPSAPDLFTALRLEPARSAPSVDGEDPTDDADTSPLCLHDAGQAHTRVESAAAAPPRRTATPPPRTGMPPPAPVSAPRPRVGTVPVVAPAAAKATATSHAESGIPPSPFGGAIVAPHHTAEQTSDAHTAVITAPVPARAPADRFGLADLLEPSSGSAGVGAGIEALVAEMSSDLSPQASVTGRAAVPLVALDDAAAYPPSGASGVRPAAPMIPPSPAWDDGPVRGRSTTWVFVALSLVLAGTLGWVLYTQTDLFDGDIVAKRDAEARARAAAELAEANAQADARTDERGTFTLTSDPPKARVWIVYDGPEAKFAGLAPDGEYMVGVTAPDHMPRVRVVKGSELVAPVVVDLDPLTDEQKAAPLPPIPAAEVPKVGRDATRSVTLALRSNTPGARLMLLVGYTPGATVVDLDVRQTHRFLVTLDGHAPHELEIKGRHWEETDAGDLVYDERVELEPLPVAPAGSTPANQPER